MATMYVSYYGGEFRNVATGLVGSTTITTSGSTAKTAAAAPEGAQVACVWSDAAHYVKNGTQATVTATATNGTFVPASVEKHFTINPGDGIAAITV